MEKAAALVRDDAVVRVLGRVLRQADAEGRPLLHALEDEVDTVGIALLHAAQPRQHVVLLAYPLLGPFDRDRVIARVGFHPILESAVRWLSASLLTSATPTISRKKWTTISGRDSAVR